MEKLNYIFANRDSNDNYIIGVTSEEERELLERNGCTYVETGTEYVWDTGCYEPYEIWHIPLDVMFKI